jgi:beta-glucosidase
VHHLLLGHGLAVEAFRAAPPKDQRGRKAAIGLALNPATPRPATARPEDLLAASRASDERTALFMDPLFGRGYPKRHLAAYPEVAMPVESGDYDKIAQRIDFLAVNYYNEDVVEAAPVSTEHPEGFKYSGSWQERTDMGWSIVPGGLARLLRALQRGWNPPALVVTENGAAFRDEPDAAGRVADLERIDYLRGHIGACEQVVAEGVPLRGYFVWSLMDNFEWSFGYSKRFGIVHVDFATQVRRPKDSYWWYRDLVAGFGDGRCPGPGGRA